MMSKPASILAHNVFKEAWRDLEDPVGLERLRRRRVDLVQHEYDTSGARVGSQQVAGASSARPPVRSWRNVVDRLLMPSSRVGRCQRRAFADCPAIFVQAIPDAPDGGGKERLG
jgi:hypothetical protein